MYVGEEGDQVITPAHFLVLQRLTQEPGGVNALPELELNLQARLRKVQSLLNRFWDQWKRHYLLSLRERGIWGAHGTSTEPQVGEVVAIHEEHLPRLRWKLVRIVQIQEGRDGKIRSAVVQVSRGNRIRHPVSLLYPLEVSQ